jgi:hypothetical protein
MKSAGKETASRTIVEYLNMKKLKESSPQQAKNRITITS